MNLSQIFDNLIGRLLRLEAAEKIEGYRPGWAADWARDSAWLLFGCIALALLAVVFYARFQRRGHVATRTLLAVLRAAVLCLLLMALARPTLEVTVGSRQRPLLYLVFDGTDSMAIEDELTAEDRTKLEKALGIEPGSNGDNNGGRKPSRADYVKALVRMKDGNLLEKLQEKARLQAFLFDDAKGIRSLELAADGSSKLDVDHLADQLTTDGEVTALGTALEDLARRQATGNGLIVFSDFNQNTGTAAATAAKKLGVKIYTVGVGATAAVDVAVSLDAPLILKKDERSTVTVILDRRGLDADQQVDVTLSVRKAGGTDATESELTLIERRTVTLKREQVSEEFAYVPDETGRYALVADVKAVIGEVVEENNRAEREVSVRDDYLRLLFVEYEPSWEWRFIKEVFHRDKLVGTEGFRTFLRSADPRVMQTDPMFLSTMSPPRSKFFENDVIFLGDVPASALSPRFCEMTREFVGDFGGGLVVIAGPRFGPGQLAETPLADLLPVQIDPSVQVFDSRPFLLEVTADAARYDFMQLGANETENRLAWDNLGPLPWYQPVERLSSEATALAVHPNRYCVGKPGKKEKQPIIATHTYGSGEVVYIGFNETWRLRKMYGEQYYRQFWGQMIHRLGLRHALGSQKRFVVKTDSHHYQADENVVLTVDAYDDDYQPLSEEELEKRGLDRRFIAKLHLPGETSTDDAQTLSVTQLRKGTFEVEFPVFAEGEHRVSVKDPITGQWVETTFKVTGLAVERQRAVRDLAVQEQLARAVPGGGIYDLTTVSELADRIRATERRVVQISIVRLWFTWLFFGLIVGPLLIEWLLRKRINLS